MNDLTLIQEILSHKPNSFEKLVHQYQKLVWKLIYQMVQNHDDTLELSQEVFMLVYRKLGQYRAESSLATWIGRISYNCAVRFLQKKEHRILCVNDDSLFEEAVENNAENEILQSSITQQLEIALQRLPLLQRTIVNLYYLEELTVLEISEICSIPQGTVKSHLYRARKSLQISLASKQDLL